MSDIPSSARPPQEQSTLLQTSDGDLSSSSILRRGFGKYEFIAELGRGGMGVVFKAEQADLHRTVAIKMILAGSDAGPEELRRFRTEAEATAGLRHPNIVRIYEVSETNGTPYFSMEYIDGHNLSQRLAAGPLPSKLAAQHVAKLAGAIQHAHDHNILHR